jgi:hypothetical protein
MILRLEPGYEFFSLHRPTSSIGQMPRGVNLGVWIQVFSGSAVWQNISQFHSANNNGDRIWTFINVKLAWWLETVTRVYWLVERNFDAQFNGER